MMKKKKIKRDEKGKIYFELENNWRYYKAKKEIKI